MSGTRSISRTEPVTRHPHLLIAAHGDKANGSANAALLALRGEVALHHGAEFTHCAVLSGEPSFAVLQRIPPVSPVLVFPMFLSNGYFVSRALPERLRQSGVPAVYLPPLGMTEDYARLTAGLVSALPDWKSRAIVIVAHGSTKDDRSREATELFASRIGGMLGTSPPSCTYLEEAPFARNFLKEADRDSVVISHFAGCGLHGGTDLQDLLARVGEPGFTIVRPSLQTKAIARIILEEVSRHPNTRDENCPVLDLRGLKCPGPPGFTDLGGAH